MTEAVTDPLEGNRKYRIISELGRGGMGEVFLGEHTALGAKVVIKLLHAELSRREGLVDRMRLEAQALARLSHPNIVRVTDFDATPSGRPFFVMEYLPGKTLSDYVHKKGGFLSVAEAIDITCQALSGLTAAHDAGMVHRDMKLDNLFVCDPSTRRSHSGVAPPRMVKILDFGIAKVLHGAGDGAPAPLMVPTSTGMVVGTPRFFAPEQARGHALDGRADIYAMGLVLYAMLAGRGPFDDATSVTEMAKAHVIRKPDPVSRFARQPLPPALDQAVLRAIAKRPDDRFQTALAFEQALRAIGTKLDETDPQPGHPAARAIAGANAANAASPWPTRAGPHAGPPTTSHAGAVPHAITGHTGAAHPTHTGYAGTQHAAAAQHASSGNASAVATQYQTPAPRNAAQPAQSAVTSHTAPPQYAPTAPLPDASAAHAALPAPTQSMRSVAAPPPAPPPAHAERVATGAALLIVLLSGMVGAASAALYLRFLG